MWPFTTNMFHLAKCFQGSTIVACLSIPSHFVDSISFYEYITFFHPFSNWWTFGVVFAFWLLWTCVYNLWVSVCLCVLCVWYSCENQFQLFWVYNKEWIFNLMVTLLNLLRNCQCFPNHFIFLIAVHKGSNFSIFLPELGYNHCSVCKELFQCGLDLHIPSG